MSKHIGFAGLLSILLLAGQGVSAQTGDLCGSVTDSTGAPNPSATIKAENTATGDAGSSKSDGDGQYCIDDLPAGAYRVTFSSLGFRPTVFARVDVPVDGTATVNAQLNTGELEVGEID